VPQAATNSQAFGLLLPADTFVDADVNDTLTLAASGPAWLAFNPATATFTGTPPLPGTNTVVLIATDREGLTATNSFVIVVADSATPPAPAGPQPTLRAITTEPTFFLFTYQVNQGVTTSQAVLEMSSNLVTWTSAESVMAASTVTPFDATSDTVTYYLPRASVSATNRFFFRVRISP
jgi:hypothetical protein